MTAGTTTRKLADAAPGSEVTADGGNRQTDVRAIGYRAARSDLSQSNVPTSAILVAELQGYDADHDRESFDGPGPSVVAAFDGAKLVGHLTLFGAGAKIAMD